MMAVLSSLVLAGHLVALAAASAIPAQAPHALQVRQTTSGLLFGPLQMPSVAISNISVRLINFNDEVFDISSISVFGDINDSGDCTEPAEGPVEPSERPSGEVVLGPGEVPSSFEIRDVDVTLINFNDEVFDISSISVFGNINDGACPQATA